MKISILICSYGSEAWRALGEEAAESAKGQGAFDVITVHDETATLAQVRNEAGFAAVASDWLCFLDADDTLAPGYIDAMMRAHDALPKTRDAGVLMGHPIPRARYDWLLVPALKMGDAEPSIPAWDANIYDINCAVIGTLIPRELFVHVGGFREFAVYEDWELWLRCIRDGARLVPVPDAVYEASVNPQGRNQSLLGTSTYKAIREEHAHVTKKVWLGAKK